MRKSIILFAAALSMSLCACNSTEKKPAAPSNDVTYVKIWTPTADGHNSPAYYSEPVIDKAVGFIDYIEETYDGSSEAPKSLSPEERYYPGELFKITLSDGRQIEYTINKEPHALRIDNTYYYDEQAISDTYQFYDEIINLSLEEEAAGNDSEETN